jgi:hypothetical protein
MPGELLRITRHEHLATDHGHGRGGALPRASDTIVSVRLGESLPWPQDRSVIATVSDRAGMSRIGRARGSPIPRSPRARLYDRYQRAYHRYPLSRAHHAALGYLMIVKTIFST